MSKKGSKNNIANRGKAAAKKIRGGKEITDVKFMRASGATFVAGKYPDGKLVVDAKGNPVPYDQI